MEASNESGGTQLRYNQGYDEDATLGAVAWSTPSPQLARFNDTVHIHGPFNTKILLYNESLIHTGKYHQKNYMAIART